MMHCYPNLMLAYGWPLPGYVTNERRIRMPAWRVYGVEETDDSIVFPLSLTDFKKSRANCSTSLVCSNLSFHPLFPHLAFVVYKGQWGQFSKPSPDTSLNQQTTTKISGCSDICVRRVFVNFRMMDRRNLSAYFKKCKRNVFRNWVSAQFYRSEFNFFSPKKRPEIFQLATADARLTGPSKGESRRNYSIWNATLNCESKRDNAARDLAAHRRLPTALTHVVRATITY